MSINIQTSNGSKSSHAEEVKTLKLVKRLYLRKCMTTIRKKQQDSRSVKNIGKIDTRKMLCELSLFTISFLLTERIANMNNHHGSVYPEN
jgi:hypothetical protein